MKMRNSLINPLWAAPEILSEELFSEKSDVYALGLMMWETRCREIVFTDITPVSLLFSLLLSSSPYSSLSSHDFLKEAMDRLRVVKERVIAGERPPLRYGDAFDELMKKCWDSNPSERPEAHEVLHSLVVVAQEMGSDELASFFSFQFSQRVWFFY